MVNELAKNQIQDTAIVEEDELASKGLAGTPYQSSLSVTSITSGTKTIQFASSVDLLEPRAEIGDIVKVLSGAALGAYTIASIDAENYLVVVNETIATSGATTASLYYPSGADITGFDNSTNGFTANRVQPAIEEAKATAAGVPRSACRSTYNGVVGNNNWLGPNELLPNTPLVTFALGTRLNEISWSNANGTDRQFHIQFRRGSKTGTIFYTMTVTSPNLGYGYVAGLNFEFAAGDTVWAQYLDDGNNCADMDLILWTSRIP